MDWSMLLQVTTPIAALIAWGWLRLDKRFESIDKRFDLMDKKLDRMSEDIRSLDSRLSHLEGAFLERGYWQSRKLEGEK